MQTIKVVTLNLWGESAPLGARLRVAVEGLQKLAPDLVALQEVRVVDGMLHTAESLGQALGLHVAYEGATPWGGGVEGLALLSRFPVARRLRQELPHPRPDERRICAGAVVDTPAGPLAAFTTHLHYRLSDGAQREDQVVAVDELVASVESDLPKIVMGDFNATSSSDEIRFMRGLHSLNGKRVYYQDAFERAHPGEPGLTWTRKNTNTKNLAWLDLERRIDYIFVTPERRDGRGRVVDCRVVLDEPNAHGLYASDHFAVFAEIQIAS